MSAVQFNQSSLVDAGLLNFPTPEDLVNYTVNIKPIAAILPPAIIEERIQDSGGNSKTFSCMYKFLLFTDQWQFLRVLGMPIIFLSIKLGYAFSLNNNGCSITYASFLDKCSHRYKIHPDL